MVLEVSCLVLVGFSAEWKPSLAQLNHRPLVFSACQQRRCPASLSVTQPHAWNLQELPDTLCSLSYTIVITNYALVYT